MADHAGHGGRAARAALVRRGFQLEFASMAWTVVEATVAIAAGVAAHSIALVGFGLDSVVELVAGGVVVWQLRGDLADEARETQTVRVIGATFFVLAGYISVEAVRDLAGHARPETAPAGIAVAAAALVVMPLLALGKRRVGRALDNRTLLADAAETSFCAALSATALAGLALNALAGWWWADPAAALGIAALAVKEGWEAWDGDHDPD